MALGVVLLVVAVLAHFDAARVCDTMAVGKQQTLLNA